MKEKSGHFKGHSDSIVDRMAGEGIKDSLHICALQDLMHSNEEEEQGFAGGGGSGVWVEVGKGRDIASLFLVIPLNSQPLNFDIQTGSLEG